MTTQPTAESLRRAFDVFDTDKSGGLSVAELKAILTRPAVGGGANPLSDADVKEIVDQFDENKDGVLQIDEVTPTTPHPVHSLLTVSLPHRTRVHSS